MLPVVLLGLIVSILVLSLIVALIFLRAAFWGEQDMGEDAKAVLTWRPPFMRGTALRNWAATTIEQLAKNRLAGKRTDKSALQLAAELEEGAVQAMLPLAHQAELERIVACPETGQGMIGVTALEALAIAAHLRNNRSRAEQKRIHDLAVENSNKIASRARGELLPLPCPLQGRDQVCCVYAVRPLRCRPLHAISVAKSMGSRRVEVSGAQAETADGYRHEWTVERGIEIGLARALKSAGLDGNVYELNSALALALERPEAAECWLKGENVFAGCHCPEEVTLTSHLSPSLGTRTGLLDA
jgi:Fe-S-cluster containining protein